jgi:hypothetical protein
MTPERLHELLNYDADTGLFTWAKPRRKCSAGAKAGCIAKNGYMVIRLDDTLYLAHRLAWLYQKGVWPTEQIDHINGDRSDNRFNNLREVSNAENAQNNRKPKPSNKSGFLGVRKENSKWLAEIKINYKPIRIGLFNTPEAAHKAYVMAKRKLHKTSTL